MTIYYEAAQLLHNCVWDKDLETIKPALYSILVEAHISQNSGEKVSLWVAQLANMLTADNE